MGIFKKSHPKVHIYIPDCQILESSLGILDVKQNFDHPSMSGFCFLSLVFLFSQVFDTTLLLFAHKEQPNFRVFPFPLDKQGNPLPFTQLRSRRDSLPLDPGCGARICMIQYAALNSRIPEVQPRSSVQYQNRQLIRY